MSGCGCGPVQLAAAAAVITEVDDNMDEWCRVPSTVEFMAP